MRSKKTQRIGPKAISPIFFASAPQKISEETARLLYGKTRAKHSKAFMRVTSGKTPRHC
mgnify:CR=1 FL=1